MYNGDVTSVPACPTVMPTNDDENVGNPVGTIDCENCACGPAKNQICTTTVVEYADTACTDLIGSPDPTACQTAAAIGDGGGLTATTFVSGGSCASSVAMQTPSPITWPNVARLCSRDDDFLGAGDAGCPTGQLCVPDGLEPYLPHTCIRQMHADADCPAPWTQKTTTYNNVNDNRDCSPTGCSCDGPAGSTCTGFMHVFTASTGCLGGFAGTRLPTTACVPILPSESARVIPATLSITDGGCAPSGAPTATGGVAGGSDVNTICCVP